MSAATLTRRRSDALLPAAFALLVLLMGLAYLGTWESVIGVWLTTDAFTHGFLVFPLSAYMVWRRREELALIDMAPSWLGAAAVAAMSLLWWLGEMLGVQVAMHFAAVMSIPAAIIAVFGPRFASAIRFPLLFLLFAVPFGEFAIPALIDFTAGFAASALNLLGIPVYQDGRFFYVPSGSYEVAKACAGLKFTIATLMLAVLVGHHYFARTSKIAAFTVLAVAAAVLANGVRATIVVLLMHFTDMDIGYGPDHAFVGWIVYALLVVGLVWLAARWQDSDVPSHAVTTKSDVSRTRQRGALIVGMAVVGAVAGPLLDGMLRPAVEHDPLSQVTLPAAFPGWVLVPADGPAWEPAFSGYSSQVIGSYGRGVEAVDVVVLEYRSQQQGSDITDSTQRLVDPAEWTLGNDSELIVDDGSRSVSVREVVAERGLERRRFWYWYEVNGQPVSGVLRTKAAELFARLRGRNVSSTVTIISAEAGPDAGADRDRLSEFLARFQASLRDCRMPADGVDTCLSQPELADLR